jgi:hypothetical protein
MKQSAHMPMVEEPTAYADAVPKFMAGGVPAPKSTGGSTRSKAPTESAARPG